MPPVLALGFRLFFLLGVGHAALVMLLWLAVLRGVITLPLAGLAPVSWHAHELLFGFVEAIVTGFLLTAVRNWTKEPTPVGAPLGALGALWAAPRVLLTLGGPSALVWAAAGDFAFGIALFVAVARPILAARQGRQAGILAKVGLLLVAQGLFYAGAAGWLADGVRLGLYTALFLILGLVVTIARRVVVPFVRSALPGTPAPPEQPWLDRAALAAFIVFFLTEVVYPFRPIATVAATVLVVLHAVRLRSWLTAGVVGRSMLWVLFLAYSWIILGFLLYALAPWLSLAPALVVHAWTVGGVGVMILGMVSRVTLGHTGRDVRENRPFLGGLFALGGLAALVRVAGPWLFPGAQPMAWELAGCFWVLAFGALFAWGVPMWSRARPDGEAG